MAGLWGQQELVQGATNPFLGSQSDQTAQYVPQNPIVQGAVSAASAFNPTRAQATAYAQAHGLPGWDQAWTAMQKANSQGQLDPSYGGTQGGGQDILAQQARYEAQNSNNSGTPVWDAFHGLNSNAGGEPPAGQPAGGNKGLLSNQSSAGKINLGPSEGGQNVSPQFNAASTTFPSGQQISYQSPIGQPQQQQGSPQGGSVQMQQQSPQDALGQYKNTAGYQLLGNNQAQQFQQSPGYQYAVDQAMNQVQQSASSRGLLESGSALRGMTDRAQGMASQEYNNWWNQNSQLYGDYQNRLQGLAGGDTGANNAFNLGANQGQAAMNAGGDVASLFGNQGNAGYGGMMNVGSAQANNMNSAGTQQAQVNSANQATQLAGAAYNRGLF